MASTNAIEVSALLGKFVVLSESVAGFQLERRGRVTAVLKALPGCRHEEAILLEEEGREADFYHLGDITLHHIE